MINIEEAIINKLIYHQFSTDANKTRPSDTLFEYENEDEATILKKIFLKPFLNSYATYEFVNNIDLELNTLYKISQSIQEGEDFISKSQDIYTHLFNVSKHPNIKDGDLFIINFNDIQYNNKYYEALGIYKVENKESFIETNNYSKSNTGLAFKKGISSKKLDKACLILFSEKPYTILLIDNARIETDYWQNEFIKLDLKKDHVNNTNQFLSLAKTYITDQFPQEFEISKADQIDLLNRSVDYFKKHENFDKQEFEAEVLQHDNIINSFNKFDHNYRNEYDLEIADDFTISPQAVKKQERVFKSVLKLDKNFHIYIHGDRQLIEKGVEKDGRKFYKIYYQDEN